MGLEPVLTPNLPNRAVAHALRLSPGAMGARGRPRGQGRIDDGLHFRRTELLPSARPRGLTEHPRHPVGDKPPCPQTHGHPTDVQRPRDGRGRFMVRQHPHQPRPTRNLLGRRPLAGHPGLLGRRCEDTVPLNEHAPPYQTVAQSTALCVQLFRTQDTSSARGEGDDDDVGSGAWVGGAAWRKTDADTSKTAAAYAASRPFRTERPFQEWLEKPKNHRSVAVLYAVVNRRSAAVAWAKSRGTRAPGFALGAG